MVKWKDTIKKMIPSYRNKEAIIDELSNLKNELKKLNNRINDLDKKNEYLFFCLQHSYGETDLETRKRIFLELPKADGRIREFQIA